MKPIKSTLALILSATIFIVSCSSDEEVNPGTPPEMPPIESMQLDNSNFTEDNSGGRLASQNNWGHAALQVGVWNTILAVQLVVPVSAFAAAVNQTPTYNSDRGLWVWSFDHKVLGRTYTSELTADLVDDGVEWEMHISQENGFQNVLWYSGFTAESGSSGYWILSKDGNNPVEYLRIDWEKENDELGNIKYTHIEEGADGEGSYIYFEKTDGTDFNRSYDISLQPGGNNIEIDWNSESGNGRIKNPNHYGDENFRCWDTNFDDVDC